MAKKKAGKAAAKGKARSKKPSVKKRPVKSLGARKSKRVKGGVTGTTTQAPSLTGEAVNKLGTPPAVGDKYIKLQ